MRRQAQIRLIRDDLDIRSVRGNVQTRLEKLREGYDCLVMAKAGFERLPIPNPKSPNPNPNPNWKAGFERLGYLEDGPHKLTVYDISPREMLHAVGQGALACECRTADVEIASLLRKAVGHTETEARVNAERSFLRAIGGGCQVPLGVDTSVTPDGILKIEGGVFSEDGTQSVRAKAQGPADEADAIGKELAQKIKANGGEALMAAIARG